MARRKQTVAQEEPQKPSVISADDAIKEEIQRINDEKTSDFLGEEVKDNKVVAPEEEAKKEKVEEPAKPVEKEIEIDPEAMKKDIADKVSKETIEKITKALTGEEKTTEAQKDKYQEWAEKFYAEKGRNPTWFELIPFIKDELKADMKNEEEMTRKQREEYRARVEADNNKRTEAFNKYVDQQLEDLYKNNKLPRIVNKDDDRDPGVVARKALFQTMLEVNQERVKNNLDPIYSVKEIYYEYYKAPNRQPAGADAPISIGRGNAQVDSGEDYSYADIRKKSFLDIFTKR